MVIFGISDMDPGRLSHINAITLDRHHRYRPGLPERVEVTVTAIASWTTMDYDGLDLYQQPGFVRIPTLASVLLLRRALEYSFNVPWQVMPSGSHRLHRLRQPPNLLQDPSSKDLL